jgi:hypothetical protein
MDWDECCNKRTVKDVVPDESMVSSLVRSSKNKLKSEAKLPMSEVTAVSKLSLAYDSLRELMEALALRKGYKIYNHECYTAFLKEIIKESDKGADFDELRRTRNAVNYYGETLTVEEADRAIAKIKSLRNSVYGFMKN